LLARALYRNPDALFLDEGTANLDSGTEDQIARMVGRLRATRVVIAHRPALIEKADFVIELDKGQLRLLRGPAQAPAAALTTASLSTT
jgi:ATP-binding cassette subfamily B protein RaxB